MWKQSLLIRILTVLLARAGDAGLAISYCSNSFRFDQLCPDPRFGSREAGVLGSNSANLSPDTFIRLNDNNYHRSRGSSMSIKDPSTKSCDFHRNGMERAVVTAVHVTENPWNFKHANQCSHIVKFNYDLFDGDGSRKVRGGVENMMDSASTGSDGSITGGRHKVCQNEIGFGRQSSQPKEQSDNQEYQGHDDEVARKTNVYFWHNFTLYSHSAEFVDTITNFHWSKEDIACVQEKQIAQYVQLAVVVSKGGRCEIIVQQYKIDKKRDPWGCSGTNYMIPYPIQFCGSYDCSQSNAILTNLKLFNRRDSESVNKNGKKAVLTNQNGHKGNLVKYARGSSTSLSSSSIHQQHLHNSGEGTNSYRNYSGGGTGIDGGSTADTTTSKPNTKQDYTVVHDSSEVEETEPVNWTETIFRFAFPTAGVILIFVVLYCLRSSSGSEICRGRSQSYPNNQHDYYLNHQIQPSIYQGSFNSIDKQILPM